ncbi:MAG: hypothetical protein ING40_16185 [Burkholderiales bacterium]|jgi:hypothetical protein|nr:hypothetical protein [Burkholderiales bacterium]MCA3230555.1 hypothetical protein [Burkholderiales bacterium]
MDPLFGEPLGWLLLALPVAYVFVRVPMVTSELLRSMLAGAGAGRRAEELIARFERGRNLDQAAVLFVWILALTLPWPLGYPLFAASCWWFTERARARFDWLQRQ